VLGAYFLLFPRARIVTLIPIFFFAWFIEIPAVIFLGFWFISQLYSGVAALGVQGANLGGVAWWAHVGGFLFGLFVARQLPHRRKYEHDFPGPGGYPWQ
jgi:membrane associated rhomboid family serine protease